MFTGNSFHRSCLYLPLFRGFTPFLKKLTFEFHPYIILSRGFGVHGFVSINLTVTYFGTSMFTNISAGIIRESYQYNYSLFID